MGDLGLERLRIESLRNILEMELRLQGKWALFLGGNGAGKTTVLESVYLLARGKSFRGRRSGEMTSVGRSKTTVEGDVADAVTGSMQRISFVRRQTLKEVRVNGVLVTDRSRVAPRFVVRLVGDASSRLFEGEPAVRRGFLDLNLFHVEQSGGNLLQRFKRSLEQRNAWLRGGGKGRAVWDAPFVVSGRELHCARERLFEELNEEFVGLSRDFGFLSGSRLVLRSGWGDCQSLAEALFADRKGERTVGYTRVGPQRADFGVSGQLGDACWSRGQVKVLVCLLQLAFDRVQSHRLGCGSIWLLDDLWAELDSESSRAICELFCAAGGQCLFTAAGGDRIEIQRDLPSDTQLFHVERGAIVDAS